MTTYKVTRLFADDTPNRLIFEGISLEEAQAWCRRDDTHGDGWFDGYDAESPVVEEDGEVCGDCLETEEECRCAYWDAVAEDDRLEMERGA